MKKRLLSILLVLSLMLALVPAAFAAGDVRTGKRRHNAHLLRQRHCHPRADGRHSGAVLPRAERLERAHSARLIRIRLSTGVPERDAGFLHLVNYTIKCSRKKKRSSAEICRVLLLPL